MEKIEIRICLGSSCFSRGNKEILTIIKSYLKNQNLEEITFFKGAHCFGECSKGPILQISDKIYENVTPESVHEILEKEFK